MLVDAARVLLSGLSNSLEHWLWDWRSVVHIS